MGSLLLNLMTAISTGEVNDEPQFPRGMVHVLSLEFPLLGLIRPGEAFVEVESSVDYTGERYHTPPNRFQQLQKKREVSIYKSGIWILCLCGWINLKERSLTIPPTSSAPMVPWLVTDAMATRDMMDQSTWSSDCGVIGVDTLPTPRGIWPPQATWLKSNWFWLMR